jgi:hypothetical protein
LEFCDIIHLLHRGVFFVVINPNKEVTD